VLTASQHFQYPTRCLKELWQTDFTYLHVVGWGRYYLSTVLDDFSRYILAWTLRTSMSTTDVMETLDLVRAAGLAIVDNDPCYISCQLAAYLETNGLAIRGVRPIINGGHAAGIPAPRELREVLVPRTASGGEPISGSSDPRWLRSRDTDPATYIANTVLERKSASNAPQRYLRITGRPKRKPPGAWRTRIWCRGPAVVALDPDHGRQGEGRDQGCQPLHMASRCPFNRHPRRISSVHQKSLSSVFSQIVAPKPERPPAHKESREAGRPQLPVPSDGSNCPCEVSPLDRPYYR
jgi:hypothetical protein